MAKEVMPKLDITTATSEGENSGARLEMWSEEWNKGKGLAVRLENKLAPWKQMQRVMEFTINMTQGLIRVGNGGSIKFWWDNWCEGGQLANRFPRLYLLSAGKDYKISQSGGWLNGTWTSFGMEKKIA
ncbi:hypothetical protein SLEP1_g48017 [Rubroshorea leprosula]|uniref:Uncharacterized protein n=1 Tax=Rubroshorea leprosula TaxID=152421 RepID=A0AAV5LV96_9ROSI|nr:hypothetical protein SLEP1_g48017 [Rubroshorea leprosula]